MALAADGTAFAQDTAAAAGTTASNAQDDNRQADPSAKTDAEIVVTGTLIRGVAPTGSNLLSVGREQIKESGAATVRDVLGTLPQLGNFQQSQRPGVAGAQQITYLPNLRNLGPSATLTLLDSHRFGSTADPNAIPTLALQRVEIVADGASSIYGSDAVAGVVNFITRRDLDGIEVMARSGVANNYAAEHLGAAAGKRWATGFAMIAYEFSAYDHLSGVERPGYYIGDLRPFGGNDGRGSSCRLPNITAGGTTYAYPGLAPGTNRCDSSGNDLLPSYQRHNVLASVRQQIGSGAELWAEGLWSRRKTLQQFAATPLQATITTANPFFQPIPGSTATSETVAFSSASLTGKEYNYNRSSNEIHELAGGVDVHLGPNWTFSAYGNYVMTETITHEPQSLNGPAVAAAAAGTTAATALDPFRGRTSPAVIASIYNFDFLNDGRQSLLQGVANLNGSLFRLPGGDVRLAIGGEARRERLKAHFEQGPIGSPTDVTNATGTRKVYSAYAELFVPIVGTGNAMPFIRQLNLSVSGRYDHYSDFGSTTNPKVGATWEVLDGLKLRGSWGRSFHAPNLTDLHAIDGKVVTIGAPLGQVFLGPDFQFPGGYNAIVIAGGNPTLQPEKAKTYSFGADFTPRALQGLRASVTYYNVKYSNLISTPPFGSAAMFTDPSFAQFVFRNATPALIAQIGAGLPPVLLAPSNPLFPTTLFDLRRQNLGARNTDGIDFDVNFRQPTSIGTVHAGVVGEYVLDFTTKSSATSPSANALVLGTPKLRSRASLGLTAGPLEADIFANYNSSIRNQLVVATVLVNYQLAAMTTFDSHLGYTFGAGGWLQGAELTFDVLNIFNRHPPVGPAGPRADVNVIGREFWAGVRIKF